MYDREWKEILDTVQNLNSENIICIIKEKLYVEHRSVYIKWKDSQFDINYLFQIQDTYISNECTLLHISAFHGVGSCIIDALLKNGANVNALDSRYKATPLHWAARFGNKDVAEVLLKKGAKVDATDRDKATPLHRAAGSGSAKIAKALLEKKAEVNVVDSVYGATPLHWAARSGNTKIVKALLAEGAKIDAVDQEGETPLHHATENSRKRVAKALLKRGADPSLSNYYGNIPEDLAKISSIKQLFKKPEEKISFKRMITTSCFVVVLGAVFAVWFIVHKEISIKTASSVFTFVAIMALVISIFMCKTLDTVLSTEPSTTVNRAQTIREEEQIQEL